MLELLDTGIVEMFELLKTLQTAQVTMLLSMSYLECLNDSSK